MLRLHAVTDCPPPSNYDAAHPNKPQQKLQQPAIAPISSQPATSHAPRYTFPPCPFPCHSSIHPFIHSCNADRRPLSSPQGSWHILLVHTLRILTVKPWRPWFYLSSFFFLPHFPRQASLVTSQKSSPSLPILPPPHRHPSPSFLELQPVTDSRPPLLSTSESHLVAQDDAQRSTSMTPSENKSAGCLPATQSSSSLPSASVLLTVPVGIPSYATCSSDLAHFIYLRDAFPAKKGQATAPFHAPYRC